MRKLLIFICLLALPANAQTLPDREACEAVYSVQKLNCTSVNIYRCANPEATVIWQEYLEGGDPPFDTLFTADGDILYDANRSTGKGMLQIIENRDPFSLGALLNDGFETVDQLVLMQFPPFIEPSLAEIQERTELIDETVQIDGHDLQRAVAYYTLSFTANALRIEHVLQQYIDRQNHLFFTGDIVVELFGHSESSGDIPTRIIPPSASGVLPDRPLIGCGEVS
jgi:hypothetical protein